jgi:hypothetical protein
VRTARWRKNVPAAFTPAFTLFIHTLFLPPPPLFLAPPAQQHSTPSLARSARAAATKATADTTSQLGSRDQPTAPAALKLAAKLGHEPA